MNVLALLEEKRNEYSALVDASAGIDAALSHIRYAEEHFRRARHTGDAYLYTDVVYRTNHAFEGLLVEAHRVLSGKTKKLTLAEIERFFVDEGLVERRVLDQFTHYRQEWRNPSTHDYGLKFSEAEGFLAIVSVAGFFYVALDQMITKAAKDIAVRATPTTQAPPHTDFVSEFTRLVQDLPQELHTLLSSSGPNGRAWKEAALVGLAAGILERRAGLRVQVDPRVVGPRHAVLSPDLIVARDDQRAVIELKILHLPARNLRDLRSMVQDAIAQVEAYIVASSSVAGAAIIVAVPDDLSVATVYEYSSVQVNSNVIVVAPKLEEARDR